jgi:hypothetical protein
MDSLKEVAPIILAIATLVASIGSVITSIITARRSHIKLQDLHLAMNSRLTQLLEQTSYAKFAEGVIHGTKNSQAVSLPEKI